MNNFPKISIITPSFNQGQFIEQTIQSVINQNYPNLEYIIIDGGSTDNTLEIIKNYERYITYWISESDKGQSDAINKGLKITTGDIINWLNSDDYYEPNILFKVAKEFENSSVNVVSGRGRLFRENETIGFTKGVDVYPNNLAKTIGLLRMDQPETFYRNTAIQKMGLLNLSLNYLMDRDWWLKYLLIYGVNGISCVNDVFVNFRLHEDSKTVSQKEGFDIDHHSLFYALAKKSGFNEYTDVIRKFVKINTDITLNVETHITKDLLRKVFSYYFLLRANICYEMNKKNHAIVFYNMVKANDLDADDRRLFSKMQFRNKLPVLFVKLMRKFTR
jgi:glycosyltransferase involved in cell wall biosynthesis